MFFNDARKKWRERIKANNVLKHNFELISVLDNQKEMVIKIISDKVSNNLAFIDAGIGMTRTELINHLGTIISDRQTEFKMAIKDGRSNIRSSETISNGVPNLQMGLRSGTRYLG